MVVKGFDGKEVILCHSFPGIASLIFNVPQHHYHRYNKFPQCYTKMTDYLNYSDRSCSAFAKCISQKQQLRSLRKYLIRKKKQLCVVLGALWAISKANHPHLLAASQLLTPTTKCFAATFPTFYNRSFPDRTASC